MLQGGSNPDPDGKTSTSLQASRLGDYTMQGCSVVCVCVCPSPPSLARTFDFVCKASCVCFMRELLRLTWLLEVLGGARSGMTCMVASSSCYLNTHVGFHRGRKSCVFRVVPAWLATRGNLRDNMHLTSLPMLQVLWRSSIAMRRVACAATSVHRYTLLVPSVLPWWGK